VHANIQCNNVILIKFNYVIIYQITFIDFNIIPSSERRANIKRKTNMGFVASGLQSFVRFFDQSVLRNIM
jgi:hypothetical protein